MAVRTDMTASIQVPVAVGWKCSACGSANRSLGKLVISSSASVSGTGRNVEKAKEEIQRDLNWSWKDKAIDIITNPKENPNKFREALKLSSDVCRCGNRERWATKPKFLGLLPILFIGAIISLVSLIAAPTVFALWLIFLPFCGLLVWIGVENKKYIKNLKNLDKRFMPIIVSLNPELNAYAELHNAGLPTQADLEAISNEKVVE